MLYEYIKERELKFNISNPEKFISKDKQNAVKYTVEFESAIKTGIEENDNVYTELFLPINKSSLLVKNTGKEKDPTPGYRDAANLKIIILLHGFKSRLSKLQDYYYFISQAIENSYAVLFMHLPYHLKRTPRDEKSGQRLITNKETVSLEFFNQCVLDTIKSMDVVGSLFLTKPEYFICGISLGGMVATTTVAWEPLVKKAVLMQCGGSFYEIYWNSPIRIMFMDRFIKDELLNRKQSRQFYSDYPEFLEKYKKINPKEIDTELLSYPELSHYRQKTWFLSDPLTFAHKISPYRVLMINSKHDALFSRRSTELLYNEIGKPKIYWLNDFHTTRALRQDAVLKMIFDFFDS